MTILSSTPESVGMSSERLARIKPGMQSWVDRRIIAGANMMVARHGKVVYFDQVGHMEMENHVPLRADAIFRIYSMTKPIVCTALMTLYEEARFQLFTPVAKFIPALGGVKVLQSDQSGVLREAAQQRPMTVGDLMAHTAGFTYDFLVDSPVGEIYRQAELMHNAGRTLEHLVQELCKLPLAYQPHSKWHYSISIDVAAHLIEIISGQPLRDFLQERFFSPLGMVDTDFCVPDDKLPRLAAMYGVGDLAGRHMTQLKQFEAWQQGALERIEARESYPVAQPATFARGGHGLFSTAQDYMRFALMLLNGGELDNERLLGRKTLELMHANRIPASLLPLEVGLFPFNGYGFGLGSRTLLDVGLAEAPGTVGEFGWAGAAGTYYWVDPGEAMVGVFMTQYQGMESPSTDFRTLAYQAIVD